MSCPRQLRPTCRRSACVSACHPETDGGWIGYLRSLGELLLESDGAKAPPVVPLRGQGSLLATGPHSDTASSGARHTLFLSEYSAASARSQIRNRGAPPCNLARDADRRKRRGNPRFRQPLSAAFH